MIITGRSVRESEEEVFFALSLSFGRGFFFYSLDRSVENLKGSLHMMFGAGMFKARPPPDH